MQMIFALAIVLSLAFRLLPPREGKRTTTLARVHHTSSGLFSQPVDWYPWGAAAFGHAKELNRPILLDVGAVWRPWCDLMDRDTYTNAATADYINKHFRRGQS
jgi:Protein of unknown function, DUF255